VSESFSRRIWANDLVTDGGLRLQVAGAIAVEARLNRVRPSDSRVRFAGHLDETELAECA